MQKNLSTRDLVVPLGGSAEEQFYPITLRRTQDDAQQRPYAVAPIVYDRGRTPSYYLYDENKPGVPRDERKVEPRTVSEYATYLADPSSKSLYPLLEQDFKALAADGLDADVLTELVKHVS